MKNLFTTALTIHIASGFIAFVAAPVAMMVKKGSTRHKLWGKIFFWCMALVAASAFLMSVLHSNPFLFMVSGFSFYSVASGYRWIFRKKVKSVKDVKLIDWIFIVIAAIFNVSLFIFGCYNVIQSPENPFSYISMVFGVAGILLVIKNAKQYFNPPEKNYAWMLNHMGGMIGGYVATVTAFSAVNFHFLPTIIQWLWPTIIGVPLLLLWISSYKRKFEKGKSINELVELKEN